MSTNYYAETPDTPADEEGLHIGQHAGGWEFLWHAHNDLGLICTETWRKFLSRPGVSIVTEYGSTVRLDDFWKHATLRPAQAPAHTLRSRSDRDIRWRDGRGCPFDDRDFF